MAAGSSRSRRRWRKPAARRSSSPTSPRRAALRAVASGAAIYVLNGLMPGTAPALSPAQPAARARQHRRARGMGRVRRGARVARRRRAARRHRHEPARHFLRGGRASWRRAVGRDRGDRAGDEPLRLLGGGPSAQRACRSSAFRAFARCFPGSRARSQIPPGSSSGRTRITTSCGPASRSTAPTRRRGSRIRCGRSSTCRAASCRSRGRAGRDRRLQRDLDGEAPDPRSRSCRSAMRTDFCAPRARATSGPARKRSSPGSAVRSPAASRWT